MTAQLLASLAGIGLSLLFSYIPGLKKRFEPLSGTYKRLIMLALLAVVSAGSFGLACLGWFNLDIACDQAGGIELLTAFVLAMIANQSAYLITPKKG